MKTLKTSLWRVPLICLIAGFLWTPLMVRLLLRFAVTAPGVMDETISLVLHGGMTAAVLVLGGLFLLRGQTRRDIFLSASVAATYHIVLSLVQQLGGWTSGPAAVVFLRLYAPLEWTSFPMLLLLRLFPQADPGTLYLTLISLPNYLVPYLFVPFGKKHA